MGKRILFVSILCALFCLSVGLALHAQAQDRSTPQIVPAVGATAQKTFGTVGDVHYVDFKAKGESTIVVKDNKDEAVKVSLKDLRPDAKILVTYRKEKDEKGNERNVLISLSVIRPVADQKRGK